MNTQTIRHEVQYGKATKFRKNPLELLKWLEKNLPNKKIILGTGFGPPGIVILDMLFKVTKNIAVFYIDTDFLFDQTY